MVPQLAIARAVIATGRATSMIMKALKWRSKALFAPKVLDDLGEVVTEKLIKQIFQGKFGVVLDEDQVPPHFSIKQLV